MPEDHEAQTEFQDEAETETFAAIRAEEPTRIPLTRAATAAGLVVALGVAIAALGQGHSRRAPAVRIFGAPRTAAPSEQALPDFAGARSPVSGRITDRTAGISYDRLGGHWVQGKDVRRLAPALGSSEKTVMRAGTAEYAAAPLQPSLGNEPSGEVAANVAEEVVKSARFPANPVLTPFSPEQVPDGWMAGFQVGPSQGNWEIVVAAVFDTGLGRPAVLAVTVPKSQRALLPDIRAMLGSVRPEIQPVGRANRM